MKRTYYLSLVFSAFALLSYAQDASTIRKKHFNLASGTALSGYDPVAYFSEKKAVKGKKEFAAMHQGTTYYFSSAANATAFKNNPASYEPQYGGWCAYAMGFDGTKVEIDPATFKIVDGKLYVFYNKFFTNTLKSWNKDEMALKKKADLNWQKTYN